MDEPKHVIGGEPDMVSLCPFCIRTTVRYIGGKHCPEIGHFLAAFALGKTFGIDSALLCCRIEELTPGVQVDDQQAPEHSLLVTAEATFCALALPGFTTATTHDALLQRAVPTCPGQLGVWEEGWREL